MSTHKSIDRICCVLTILALLLTGVMVYGKAAGVEMPERTMGYEARLFDTERVHTIDIQMEDWDSFIVSCEDEAYAACTVIIDNEVRKNVAIRAKGNTSLRNVSQLGSQRYSFKIEFDHYETGKTYYGLDKLSLNNLIQDNTMMKDYLSYQLMDQFGVNAPLSSYVYLTVNGEDFGLYLAVEGIEEAFLERNYGGEGELYKPDSMDMGGGRGNGRDFDMNSQTQGNEEAAQMPENAQDVQGRFPSMEGQMPERMPGGMGGRMPVGRGQMSGEMPMEMPEDMPNMEGEMPSEMLWNRDWVDGEMPDAMDVQMSEKMPGGMGHMGGNGAADVKLQYIDEDPESYANIFGNAKTDVTEADQQRLIASLKALSEGRDISDVVDTEAVIRYFVVHNFLCNGDSYTGGMIHNYYLHENEGKLSMLPWDYNLAFGGFQAFDATTVVNEPIDTPVTGGSIEDRPMIAWIFDDDRYQAQYHTLFADFLDTADILSKIDAAAELIAPYVERDPSKFCTYEEFRQGVDTLHAFCSLRAQSIRGQLDGTIPSTTEGQNSNGASLMDASEIAITDMGSMEQGMGGRMNWEDGEMPQRGFPWQNGEQLPQEGEMPTEGFMRPNAERMAAERFSRGTADHTQTWILAGASVFVLAIGLLITRFFRKTR